MDLSEQHIDSFIDAWRADFGEELPREEARARAQALVALYLELDKPLPDETGYEPYVP